MCVPIIRPMTIRDPRMLVRAYIVRRMLVRVGST
jgi:hypothetical protein